MIRISNEQRNRYRKIINIIKPIYAFLHRCTHRKEYEVKRSFGNINADKIFYVIRSNNSTAGMYSIINTVLSHIAYAKEKGYIPVVDMKNYPNSYLAQDKVGIENSWEYYFHQPMITGKEYSLDEVYLSKNVILSSLQPIVKGYHFDASICDDMMSEEFKKYRKIFLENIRFKDDVKKGMEAVKAELFGETKVLGVLCRGTDYVTMKPYAHPIQPEISAVIEKTKELLKKHNYHTVYLATEDEEIVNQFRNMFGKELKIYGREYHKKINNCSKEYITEVINQKTSPRNAGIEYLRQIYLLTKCESLILSKTSATAAVLFSEDYHDVFIWNLGLYGIDEN